jgi:hypothetical protein
VSAAHLTAPDLATPNMTVRSKVWGVGNFKSLSAIYGVALNLKPQPVADQLIKLTMLVTVI